jgi:hypothetical protein
VAAGFKQQALLVPLAATAALIMDRAFAAAAAVAAGFAAALAAIWLPFAAAGIGGDLVYWTLTYNWLYVKNPILMDEVVHRLVFKLGPAVLPALPLALGAWLSRGERSPELRLARLAALATVPAVFAGWRFFGHYLLLVEVPLALAAAPWLAEVVWAPPGSARARARRWLLAVAIAATVASVAGNLWGYALGQGPKTRGAARIAAWLREDRCQVGATLFVWGTAAAIYAGSGLAPATRFVMPQVTISGFVFGNDGVRSGVVRTERMIIAAHRQQLIDDLVARLPTYVVDLSGHPAFGWERFPLQSFPVLEALVARGHEVVAEIDGARIWRRRDCSGR